MYHNLEEIIAIALALAQTRDWWDVPWGSQGTMEVWDGMDKMDQVYIPDL